MPRPYREMNDKHRGGGGDYNGETLFTTRSTRTLPCDKQRSVNRRRRTLGRYESIIIVDKTMARIYAFWETR